MIIDLPMNKIEIFYHMNEGDIAPIHSVYKRDLVSGFATISENTEKKNDNPEEQIKHQKIHGKEKECVSNIKSSEAINNSEISSWRVQTEKDIDACKLTNNIDEAMEKVLEVSLHDKARKKYGNDSKKRDDEGITESHENDILYPFLNKDKPINRPLSLKDASETKKLVLEKFRERIIARADIIHKRIEEEKGKVDALEKQYHKRSGENIEKEEETNFENEINRLHFTIKILNNRASRFEMNSIKKYQELQEKLNKDPRLAVIKQNEP